ncbi:uncharacterized protein G2W53_016362 [Senna tora]|uniref:Uncharacterized protein n=1 Tax=Senna tora TaxID=362788 RepID=A0A834WLG0_9FABA|nr:uncharacterized protein G2W53_016362 [Senna tora]
MDKWWGGWGMMGKGDTGVGVGGFIDGWGLRPLSRRSPAT